MPTRSLARLLRRITPRDTVGPDELLPGPLRGEPLGADRLADRALELARTQRVAPPGRIGLRAPLLARLTSTRRVLQDARDRLAQVTAAQGDVGPAGEWLLDNFHVVREHIREVHQSLPRGYYKELPVLADGPLAGYPRVYEVAITLISHTEGRVDLDSVELFLTAFQSVATLSIGELWAIPAMLRLGCLESVRRMTLRTVQRLDELASADSWASEAQEASSAGSRPIRDLVSRFLASPPTLSPTFISRLLLQLRPIRGAHPPLMRLEEWLAEEAHSAESAGALSRQRLALTQLMMANSITSLRAITHADWRIFVEHQSAMEAVLRGDPVDCYARMTFATRDRYRHVIERIAKRCGEPETMIAERAVAFAREALDANPGDHRAGHVGFYLIDTGLRRLERAAGYRPSPREAMHGWMPRHPNLVFVGGITVGTAGAVLAVLQLAGPAAWPAWPLVLGFTFLPALDIAIAVVNLLVTAMLPPRTLPKLALEAPAGIPADLRSVVVVPTLVSSVEGVEAAFEHLEVQFLANRDRHLHFALLTDFTDSDTETRPDDAAILAAAAATVEALNTQYAPRTKDLFFHFHRPRRWNPSEGTWMGWERKRGKLGEFNAFLRGTEGAFTAVAGRTPVLRDCRYVITLDSDTMLPPGAARTLVGAMAHPLNRAEFDAARGRVTRGYGILQPRVGVSLPSARRSRFAAIQSGHPGVDPYTTAVSDVYQDLYGEGSFTGKGIYDIDAFERATAGRFRENCLLSHDLIEGSYARAGLVTDVVVYDDYPSQYLSYTRRKRRWIRGDWQLLRWLTPWVRGAHGRERNVLPPLARWKIFDNLRRSTVELSQLALLVAGWTILPGSPIRWTLLAVGAIGAPWITALLLALVRPPLDRSWRAYYGAVAGDMATSARQFALTLIFLLHQGWSAASAILTTLWRLGVSRRHLLVWQTSSGAEQVVSASLRGVLRAMWPAYALGLGLAALVVGHAVLSPGGAGAGWLAVAVVPFALLWLVAPAVARALTFAPARPSRALDAGAQAQALRYAGLHWAFFERFATEATNWLAPDNFQDDPAPVVAMRTSPTNIGLQLMAIVSAFDLGFITAPAMTEQLERLLGTMDALRRYRGHFFNWYDVGDLQVLEPAYVSTVDSGNLAGHLIAVRQACLSLPVEHPAAAPLAGRLTALADRCLAFTLAMDYRFLFDEERKLFAIGYHAGSHTIDGSYYDLLASEARLASFIAIAKRDVPVDHWFHLDRSLTRRGGATALVSWAGSMFEYLMPALVMESLPSTILAQTYDGVLDRQVAFGGERHVPWGVSESAYNLRDRHFTYQYRAFGVPDLALKRGLGHDLVVAPYASLLAAMIDPARALANLTILETLGALGAFGFRDALDYTRPAPGERYAVVGNYMAHHIGMGLAALTNVLRGDVWQRRFHAEPMVQANALLLHERIPRRLVLQEVQTARATDALPDPAVEQPFTREISTFDTPVPRIALLGRLPYTVMVSAAGSGYSRYKALAVTRWRADGTTDDTGQFCYVRDVERDRVWSAAHQPVCAPADRYRALLATDRVTIERLDGEIETRTEIAVAPDDFAEVRRVTLTNTGTSPREVEVTSYGELVLAPPDADRAHPAFGNLFVETEFHAWCSAVTATRRPRSASEPVRWCVHVCATGDERVGTVTCETDRARFIGRGRSLRDPVALDAAGPLDGTVGAVLDPIVALRARVRLAPGQSSSVSFTTLVANSRDRAFALADRYHDPRTVQRALDLAWSSTQMELRELAVTPADAAMFQDLAACLLYPIRALRAAQADLRENQGSQPLLWAQGISGDWPILLAAIDDDEGIPTLRQLFAAHHYWRRRGMVVDLVILNRHPSGYAQALDGEILDAMYASNEPDARDTPGGVFLRRADQLDPATSRMLRGTARVHVVCDGRPLARTLEALSMTPSISHPPAGTVPVRSAVAELGDAEAPGSPAAIPALAFDNGIGGLAADGSYRIQVAGDRVPPAPWANVIANERGGFIVTERGAGCAWAGSSYFYRLTPWHNDPVSDPPGDVCFLQDDESRAVWSATPAPLRAGAPYVVTHRQGATTFAHERDGLATELTMAMGGDDPVRLAQLRVVNTGDRPRRLTVTSYVEWVLGSQREQTQHQVQTAFDAAHGAILATNTFDPQFAGWVAFSALDTEVGAHTGDRREFIGRNGSLAAPIALVSPTAPPLSNTTGAGYDPCAALQCAIVLGPGEHRDLTMLLGAAPDRAEALRLLDHYRAAGVAAAASAASVDAWTRRLSVVRVSTPEPAFDAMLNHWVLYQALSCRMWARSALYQSSGAYGFRDQLQDVLAFVYAEPAVARAHILRATARQFVEGDVQHWWHPQSGRGVRTRFSDDLAWLPFVVDRYLRVTGDTSVLDETVPYLTMRLLKPGEDELYDLPQVSEVTGSVYDHCLRALRHACTAGAHGLPLIGSGDWNDGMNRVGIEGRGESVWLAWFLIATVRDFAAVADTRGDTAAAAELRATADAYVTSIEAHGWDGEWYRRAYFDDGAPLGSISSEECHIDSIAQSWSVISGAGEPSRARQAMQSFETHLADNDARLLRLLTPPFDHTSHDPGYIKGYLPGVRENGAQYTHAALWAVLATAMLGDGERAMTLYQMLNPFTHASTADDLATYKVEPYVVAADVYTAAGHLGRGGWTWYTGSASWMYRVGLETILGFTRLGDQLSISPVVPAGWAEFTIDYRFGASNYHILVTQPARVRSAGAVVTVDGQALESDAFTLVDDGRDHQVSVAPRDGP
jgi:cyclic beta-1,2-glucan synthetase